MSSGEANGFIPSNQGGRRDSGEAPQAPRHWRFSDFKNSHPETTTGRKRPWNAVELTGQRFGRWTVVCRHGSDVKGSAIWLCECICGNQSLLKTDALLCGESKSCGCGRARDLDAIMAVMVARSSITDRGCWEWLGPVSRGDYGTIGSSGLNGKGRHLKVHRLAAHVWLGLDLSRSDIDVCHKCDNPRCFNPDHLFLGTRLDNVRDMHNKGRARCGDFQRNKTHCKHGHEFTEENTWRNKYGTRYCRQCGRDRCLRYYYSKKQ